MSTAIAESLLKREAIIEAGLATFIEVGQALLGIRDERQYEAIGFESFEDYCRGRFDFSARRARQLISAAEIGTQVPVSDERQARALAPLKDEPQQMEQALERATQRASAGDRPVKADDVRQAVAEVLPPKPVNGSAPTERPKSRTNFGYHVESAVSNSTLILRALQRGTVSDLEAMSDTDAALLARRVDRAMDGLKALRERLESR